ncbi:MAG: DUF305 domain-containing protein [Marinobacter sp.]|nr:DUF305 domain-containing protein [Marinobacter sp.]
MKIKPIAFAGLITLTIGSGLVVAHHHNTQAHHPAGHTPHHTQVTDAFAKANKRMMEDMHGLTLTGDADYDFVRGMIPHHQGAIDMAEVLKDKGSNPGLQTLADEIIAAQRAEIAQMQAWLDAYGAAKPGDYAKEIIAAYNRINDRMMQDMHGHATGDVDRDFVAGMIPHHVAAIDMAYVLLAYTTDPALRELAFAVIREQEREVAMMQSWLEQHAAPRHAPQQHQHH